MPIVKKKIPTFSLCGNCRKLQNTSNTLGGKLQNVLDTFSGKLQWGKFQPRKIKSWVNSHSIVMNQLILIFPFNYKIFIYIFLILIFPFNSWCCVHKHCYNLQVVFYFSCWIATSQTSRQLIWSDIPLSWSFLNAIFHNAIFHRRVTGCPTHSTFSTMREKLC